MRSIRRKRQPLVRKIAPPPEGVDLREVAARARYIGSPEHKMTPSPAGLPKPRSDASLCDSALSTRFPDITRWLRSAISNGQTGPLWEGDFPRYVWYKEADVVCEARLTNKVLNKVLGEYKGYPLEHFEWPTGLE